MTSKTRKSQPGSANRAKRPTDLLGYLTLSCTVSGFLTGIHYFWNGNSTFDFGFFMFVVFGTAATWIRMTIGLIAENQWNRFTVLPFMLPGFLLAAFQFTQSQAYGKPLAGAQIAFAVILALLTRGLRKQLVS
jgi:hypothetical protein